MTETTSAPGEADVLAEGNQQQQAGLNDTQQQQQAQGDADKRAPDQQQQAADKSDQQPASTPGEAFVAKLAEKGDNVSIHDVISALPPEIVDRLTAEDMDDLTSGDPAKVARVLQLGEATKLPEAEKNAQQQQSKDQQQQQQPGNNQQNQQADDEEAKAVREGRLPERISTRGLSAKDQKDLLDDVQAVKSGRFNSLSEARAARESQQQQQQGQKQDGNADDAPKQPATVTEIQAKIKELEASMEEAENAYDTAKLRKLSVELVRLEVGLSKAQDAEARQKAEAEQWMSDQQKHIDKVNADYADLMKDGSPFNEALADAFAGAQQRNDPILQKANWPEVLADRVHTRLYGRSRGQQPQQRQQQPQQRQTQQPAPRGRVAEPGVTAPPLMTQEEALAATKDMTEAEIDAALAAIKRREQNGKRHILAGSR